MSRAAFERPFFMEHTGAMETILLLAQTVATSTITGWLSIGLHDNLRYPGVNETYTSDVLSMGRMRDEYPEHFAQVAGRAITDRKAQRRLFDAIVVTEAVATLLLWLGLVSLIGATLGWVSAETARTLAMVGALSFTSIWSAFLVAGNYFCYWFGHEGAQTTHFLMTIWGLATLILIAI